jgi:hypothetical protein
VIASFPPAQTQIQHSVPRTGSHIVLVPFIAAAAISPSQKLGLAVRRLPAACHVQFTDFDRIDDVARIAHSEK